MMLSPNSRQPSPPRSRARLVILLGALTGLALTLSYPNSAPSGGNKPRFFRLYKVEITRTYTHGDQGEALVPPIPDAKRQTLLLPTREILNTSQKGSWYFNYAVLDMEMPWVVEAGKEVPIKASLSVDMNLKKDAPRDVFGSVTVAFQNKEEKIPRPKAGKYAFKTVNTTRPLADSSRMTFYVKDGAAHMAIGVIANSGVQGGGGDFFSSELGMRWIYKEDPSATAATPPQSVAGKPPDTTQPTPTTPTQPTPTTPTQPTPTHCAATFDGEWGDWGPTVGARRGAPPHGTQGTWGTWNLKQSGHSLAGTVGKIGGRFGPATIQATVSGNTFTGVWSAPGAKGKLSITRSADDCTMSGTYGVDEPPGQSGGTLGPPGGAGIGNAGGNPWDSTEGKDCFEKWIALATRLLNTTNLGPTYDPLRPYSFNQYGHLVNRTVSQPNAPDAWERHGRNKHRYMWEYYNTDATAGQWRGTGPDGFGSDFGLLKKAKVPTLRDFVRGCAPSSTPGSTLEPPLGSGMILSALPHRRIPLGSRGVLVPVELLNARDVMNLDFALHYSPEIVAARGSIEKGSVVSHIWEGNLKQPGLIKFNFAQLNPFSGNGWVSGFRFDAVAVGRSPLTLSVSKGTKLPLTLLHGSITVFDPRDTTSGPGGPGTGTGGGPGGSGGTGGTTFQPTCSGTGQQTVADAQCCLKQWVELIPQNLFMDLNQSGEVDSNDALIVLQNVARRLNP